MRYAVMGATVQQVRSVGGTDIKEPRRTGIIFATLTADQVTRLKAMGCHVDQVGKVGALVMPPIVAPPVPVAAAPTYSPEQLVWVAGYEELRAMMVPPLYGSGFNAALIDSGIRETHERIAGHVIYSKNFTSAPMRDGLNHGTGTCSIVLAVAPLCNILNLKVLDDKGSGTEEDVVMAIDECIDLQDTNPAIAPSIINLSLGAPDDGNPYNPMRVACRAAIEKGIWIEASAGNEGPAMQTIMSPACEKYVFATGSLKLEPLSVSSFSSRGPTKEGLTKPDVMFFGEDIVMASSVSDTATIAKSGTSFATPFHTGAALLFHEGTLRYGGVAYGGEVPISLPTEMAEFLSVQELIDTWLEYICVKPAGSPPSKDNDYGYGLLYAPLVTQALRLRPAAVDLGILTGIVGIAMVGMMMSTMIRGMVK